MSRFVGYFFFSTHPLDPPSKAPIRRAPRAVKPSLSSSIGDESADVHDPRMPSPTKKKKPRSVLRDLIAPPHAPRSVAQRAAVTTRQAAQQKRARFVKKLGGLRTVDDDARDRVLTTGALGRIADALEQLAHTNAKHVEIIKSGQDSVHVMIRAGLTRLAHEDSFPSEARAAFAAALEALEEHTTTTTNGKRSH